LGINGTELFPEKPTLENRSNLRESVWRNMMLAAFVVLSVFTAEPSSALEKHPNDILIVCDDLSDNAEALFSTPPTGRLQLF